MKMKALARILEDAEVRNDSVHYQVCRVVSGTHIFLKIGANGEYSLTDTIREAAPIDDPAALSQQLAVKWPDKQFELVDVDISISGGTPVASAGSAPSPQTAPAGDVPPEHQQALT